MTSNDPPSVEPITNPKLTPGQIDEVFLSVVSSVISGLEERLKAEGPDGMLYSDLVTFARVEEIFIQRYSSDPQENRPLVPEDWD